MVISRTKKKPRNPEQTRLRIMAAARTEFAKKGLGGARVDTIAARAKVQKRMMYHYFGNKETLYRLVLEKAYADFRQAEAALEIERDPPLLALRRLMEFTWNYYIANPEFISLVNTENLHRAKYLQQVPRLELLNKSFVKRMENLLARGVADGLFRPGLDAVQVLIMLSGLGYHYLTNRFTGEIVYGRSLTSKEALRTRLEFNIEAVSRLVCRPEVFARKVEAA
jgi:AcrR family transcriptional regulator